MSRQTTCAPSRASTVAIDFPMPLAAPVTSAVFPSSGSSQSTGVEDAAPGPILTTCPDTYADFGDSRNRSVDSIWSSAPGSTYTSCAVEPRRASLPIDRLSPSRARCAIASGGLSRLSGGVPSTITRPQARSLRITG